MGEQLLTRAAVPVQERRVPGPDAADDAVLLLAAADRDADALADAFHDGALQALVVARYAADAAVRGGDPAVARDAVQDALVALRRAVWLLRPRGADDLPTALADLSTRLDVPLVLALDADVAAALAPAARAAAYRFVQAAAGAGAGSVSLVRQGGEAVLTVDGEVADPAGWSARARALGGRFEAPARLRLPMPDFDSEGDR
jgi:signal transduction histidine kinase